MLVLSPVYYILSISWPWYIVNNSYMDSCVYSSQKYARSYFHLSMSAKDQPMAFCWMNTCTVYFSLLLLFYASHIIACMSNGRQSQVIYYCMWDLILTPGYLSSSCSGNSFLDRLMCPAERTPPCLNHRLMLMGWECFPVHLILAEQSEYRSFSRSYLSPWIPSRCVS